MGEVGTILSALVSACARGDYSLLKNGQEMEELEVNRGLTGSETGRFRMKRSPIVV